MARDSSVGLKVLAMLALAALPELACCHIAARALPPAVVCGDEGRLPDPTDCRYYVDCTKNGDDTYSYTISPCPVGTYYDSCQGDCSKTQRPSSCSVTCETEGDSILSSDNPSVYFVCIRNGEGWNLKVSRCPGGKAQDSLNGCNGDVVDCPVNNGTPGLSTCNGTYYYGDEKNCSIYYYCSAANVSADKGSCLKDQYFITYNHSCTEFRCTEEGSFADPANCSRYYSCTKKASDYVKNRSECPSGSHFDSSVGGCSAGDCTTVCPGSTKNFTCPSSGFFADPYNYRWYYYCDSSRQGTHVKCPDGSHFDSSVGSCMMGDCPNKLVDMRLEA